MLSPFPLFPSQCNSVISLATSTSITPQLFTWAYNTYQSVPKHSKAFSPVFFSFQAAVAFLEEKSVEDSEKTEAKLRWVNVGPNITEAQKQAISQLPPKMIGRCKALMKRIICFSPEDDSLSILLSSWVKAMRPTRADWLSIMKEMKRLGNPLLLELMELALLEDSFEANVRDYTKLIDMYAKHNMLQNAEITFQAMKERGFTCDQVTLTVLVHMYSKAGYLNQAEAVFEEIKLLGLPVDKRSYGAMIMAYIRAGMLEIAENLLKEMEAQEIYAGKEVYKALLRAYSMLGNTEGAQRVFNVIQLARIVPDCKLCALLVNAYCQAGQSDKARSVLENMRIAGLDLNDKCIALLLSAYEKENKLEKALSFLVDLEQDGIMVAQESSQVLASWFRRLGVVNEVELVLKEFDEKKSSRKTRMLLDG
ncbi:hypothetical protein J5N97_014406 [Dioscorea zingiberensis]|uniref:PROP1-like PPR domain-containing protein n=1 Tax=Dioscorea zingiberensis TaxID=325984 RepID=A0A9D5HK13_9LILI|nr:hypothetical protein J5N97_014406 [Dioscorea zingiberensis]